MSWAAALLLLLEMMGEVGEEMEAGMLLGG